MSIRTEPARMKVQIGINYRPSHFEKRTLTTYQALNPAMSNTNYKLQEALLNDDSQKWSFADKVVTIASFSAVAFVLIGLFYNLI